MGPIVITAMVHGTPVSATGLKPISSSESTLCHPPPPPTFFRPCVYTSSPLVHVQYIFRVSRYCARELSLALLRVFYVFPG